MGKKQKKNKARVRSQAKVGSHGLGIYRRLLKYVYPYKGLFFLSFLGYLVASITQPLFAEMIKHIIDTLQSVEREGAILLPVMFSGLIVVRSIGVFIGSYFVAKVSTNVVHDLRCKIFDHYTCLPTSYFDANNSGYMISRITHNVGEVTRATTDSVRSFIREGFTALGLLGYLAYTNWQLSLVFLAIAPVVAVMVSYVSKRMKRLSRNMQETVGDMTHIASELVVGQRVVKSFGGEEYEMQRFKESSLDNRRQYLKLTMTMSIHNPLMQFVISLALAALMYLALIIMKDSGAGEFVAFLTAAFLLPRPIRQLSDANAEIQRGIAAAESLFEVLDEPKEKNKGDYRINRAEGRLEFKNLSFKYKGAEGVALKKISFKVMPGQTVALVGASGGGKSTLINLIPRFYDYQYGSILLDGVELKKYQLESLREQIALVTQNVTLFNDTVANNIAYGVMNGASRELILKAATEAYAMEFIEKMPQGLDTDIGENGVRLSGGQRQRLALARALLKNAPILILDEATSALDTESERNIQKVLNKVMKNRTTLVVAHRLSTIENADVILVIDKGQIVERGSHSDLIGKNGAYAKLHGMQFQDKK